MNSQTVQNAPLYPRTRYSPLFEIRDWKREAKWCPLNGYRTPRRTSVFLWFPPPSITKYPQNFQFLKHRASDFRLVHLMWAYNLIVWSKVIPLCWASVHIWRWIICCWPEFAELRFDSLTIFCMVVKNWFIVPVYFCFVKKYEMLIEITPANFINLRYFDLLRPQVEIYYSVPCISSQIPSISTTSHMTFYLKYHQYFANIKNIYKYIKCSDRVDSFPSKTYFCKLETDLVT